MDMMVAFGSKRIILYLYWIAREYRDPVLLRPCFGMRDGVASST
jgi:hypothetical protein